MNFGEFFWRNGEFQKTENGKISVVNHALHYGSGAFEGIRFYETENGAAIFRLREHIERLFYSAKFLELKIPFSVEKICDATCELLQKNNFSSGYIRPIVFFGEKKMGLNPHGAEIETVIAAWPWGKYLSDDPISVGISPWRRIHPKTLPADAKITGHYVNSILSSLWAKKNNFQEALLLDCDENLAEGPGENLFLIKNGKIFTPALGNILAGITRNSIIEIAKNDGISVEEKILKPNDLFSADEAFFTGTAAEVTIIDSVDGKKIGEGKNKISENLKQKYSEIVSGKNKKYLHWLTKI